MDILEQIRTDIGAKYVISGAAAETWTRDWMNVYHWQPLAVVRPATTAEVQAIARACSVAEVAMVPVGGNTGLTGATKAQDAIMISLDRMNAIREIKPNTQVAIVESGLFWTVYTRPRMHII